MGDEADGTQDGTGDDTVAAEPPPAGRKVGLWVALAAIVAVVAAASVFVVTRSGDDDPADDTAAGEDAGEEPAATTTTSTSTSTSTTTTTAPEPAWQDVDGGAQGFTIRLPGTWRYAVLDGDATDVGAQLQPDSPDGATFADNVAAEIASTGPRLLALDGEAPDSGPAQPAFVAIERNPGDMGLDQVVSTFVDAYAGVGVTNPAQGRLTGPSGDIAWVENTASGAFSRVDYLLVHGGQVWKLTYLTFRQLDLEREVADEIATSLTLL